MATKHHYVNNQELYKALVKRKKDNVIINRNIKKLAAQIKVLDRGLKIADDETKRLAIHELQEEIKSLEKSRVSEYIATQFLKIAENLLRNKKFINYSSDWKDEMLGDGCEQAIKYIDSFDPKHKLKNPFAYFTQIIYYTFIRRIMKEKRQGAIKEKIIQKFDDTKPYTTMKHDDNPYDVHYIENDTIK